MKRFIFRFRGKGETSEADVDRIRSQSRVVDDSSPRMLLVEVPEKKPRTGQIPQGLGGKRGTPPVPSQSPAQNSSKRRPQQTSPRRSLWSYPLEGRFNWQDLSHKNRLCYSSR